MLPLPRNAQLALKQKTWDSSHGLEIGNASIQSPPSQESSRPPNHHLNPRAKRDRVLLCGVIVGKRIIPGAVTASRSLTPHNEHENFQFPCSSFLHQRSEISHDPLVFTQTSCQRGQMMVRNGNVEKKVTGKRHSNCG